MWPVQTEAVPQGTTKTGSRGEACAAMRTPTRTLSLLCAALVAAWACDVPRAMPEPLSQEEARRLGLQQGLAGRRRGARRLHAWLRLT